MYKPSLPVFQWRELNESSGTNPPKQVPPPLLIGGLNISCGPIVKLCGTHESGPSYRATIMIVVKDLTPDTTPNITYVISDSESSQLPQSQNELQFIGNQYYETDGYAFWRFNVNLKMAENEQRVQYFINGDREFQYQFFVPGVNESMNVVSYSCNGFSLGVDPKSFPSSPWFDVLQKHDKQHYHVMLGGGDQIYSDAVKIRSPELQKWVEESHHVKKHMKVSEQLSKELHSFYLDNYMSWFGKGFWLGLEERTTLQSLYPVALSTIPSINIWDDHDIIDGFGSYKDSTMEQPVFSGIGNISYIYYMLFQHHMLPFEDVHNSIKDEPSWILSSKNGPFIKQKSHSNYIRLGKEISAVGMDCRTERSLKEIIKDDTYDLIFQRLEDEITQSPEIKHLLVMLGVPILYPRLVWLEWLLTSTLLKPVKALSQKGVIAKGLVNEFDGSVEVLDDLNDHWCNRHHKPERNALLKRLLEFGAIHGVRITILSGDVHLGCVGRLKSTTDDIYHEYTHKLTGNSEQQELVDVTKNPESDPRLLFNIISSAVVNTPPPDGMASLLDKRSAIHKFNKVCEEDILPLFHVNPDGSARSNHQFLNKRNWSDLVIAKQSKYSKYIVEGEEVVKKLPGPLDAKTQKILQDKAKSNPKRYTKYPLYDDSLVTTMYFETKTDDFDCKSALYEVIVPRLEGKYKIENPGVKHLHLIRGE